MNSQSMILEYLGVQRSDAIPFLDCLGLVKLAPLSVVGKEVSLSLVGFGASSTDVASTMLLMVEIATQGQLNIKEIKTVCEKN